MAKVPTVQGPTVSPTIGPTVFQNFSSTPEAFGAPQGRAQAQAGQVAQQIGEQIVEEQRQFQIQDNNRENQRAQNRLNQELSAIEQEYKDLRGEDAVSQLQAFQERMVETRTNIQSELSNTKVIEMFEMDSAGASLGGDNRMQNHQRVQRDNAADAADVATAAEGIDRAINAFEDVDEIELASEQARIAKENTASRKGLDDATIKSEGEFAASKVALGGILAAISDGNVEYADELFNRFTTGNEILDGEDRLKAQKAINAGRGTARHKITAEARDVIRAIENGDVVRTPEEIKDMLEHLRLGGTDSELDAANDLERIAEAQARTNLVLITTSLRDQERFLDELPKGTAEKPLTDQQSITRTYYGKRETPGRYCT